MKRIAARTFAGAAVAVGLLASVVACGNSADSTVKADSSGLLPLKIGYTAAGAGYADLYDGVDYGIFKKHGLNVTIVRLNTSAQLVAALASNSVQIGVGVAADSASAIMKGAKLKFIAMSEPKYNLEMWASPDIKTIDDLKGKKVALTSPNSEGDFGLTALLQQHGISRDTVQSDYVQSAAAEVAALDSGAVSAILTQPPQGTSTRNKGAHRLAALSNLPFPLGTYTVESGYLDNNRDLVKKFVAAEADALSYLPAHEQETEAAIKKYTGENDASLDKYAYQFFLNVWAKTPEVDQTLIQQGFQEAAKKTGKTAPSDVSQYIDKTLYTQPS
ncbi:MAG TPA: ABC transporter substrate-binding protein [Pseudonocardiaceae bacterium]|jgi:NitT/TauT family transport system substrate-binding protein|nr:ABC transporter substrate-binding protein [Pseudonocardiaceae bacterium]